MRELQGQGGHARHHRAAQSSRPAVRGTAEGDVEWELGPDTSKSIKLTYERGRAMPMLSIDLAARPTGKDDKVEKQTVVFHVILKNLWK